MFGISQSFSLLVAALKQDRKRLKAEKFDLLTQMKQLYSTLEDKEEELREFIRNYEQKMKENEEHLKQVPLHEALLHPFFSLSCGLLILQNLLLSPSSWRNKQI